MPGRCLRYTSSTPTAAVAILLGAAALPAQAVDHAVLSAAQLSCLDSIPPTQLTRIPVYASVKLADSVSHVMRANAENLLQEVVIRAGALLGAPANVLPHGEPAVTWRGLAATLLVTARPDGRLTYRVPVDRGDTAAAALIARALDSSPPEARLFDWSADSLRDSVSYEIVLAWPTVDRQGSVTKPHLTSVAVPIFSVAHPWELTVAPKPGNRGPLYPDAAMRSGYTAYILMQFLVDASGRAIMSSVRDLWPKDKPRLTGDDGKHYESFVASVRRALEKMAFYPAEIGGCKTEQLVQMPFQFSLAR